MSAPHAEAMAMLRGLVDVKQTPGLAVGSLSTWPWRSRTAPGLTCPTFVEDHSGAVIGMFHQAADAHAAALAPAMLQVCLALSEWADGLRDARERLPAPIAIAVAVARQVTKETGR